MDYVGVEGDYNVMVIDILGPNLEALFQFCDKKYCSVIVLPTKAEVGSTWWNEKLFYAVLSSKWNCFLDVDCLGSRLRDQTPQLDIADGT